jgi:hypothetical protein
LRYWMYVFCIKEVVRKKEESIERFAVAVALVPCLISRMRLFPE